MKSQSLKILIACALGAFMGTVVAFQVSLRLWWLGLLVGFTVGYLAYEFKKVIAAAAAAWRKTIVWQPNVVFWKNFVKLFAPIALAIITYLIALAGIIAMVIVPLCFLADKPEKLLRWLAKIFMYGIPFFTLALAPLFTSEFADETKEVEREEILELLDANPFRIYVWLPLKFLLYQVPAYLSQQRMAIGQAVAIAGVKTGSFFWQLFVLVHSEVRLLCGVDAAIGVAVGYHYHGVILGAFVGGLWGMLNFEVLSIRVLRLVPATSSIIHGRHVD